MLRVKRKNYVSVLNVLFLLGIGLILGLFAFRVITRCEVTPMSDGQVIRSSYIYQIGRVLDRNEQEIVSGTTGEPVWSDDTIRTVLEDRMGICVEDTLNSRLTILGNCPWMFGTEDNRFTFQDLIHPNRPRFGGDVRLTLDRDLEDAVYSLIQENGYENAYAVVSNWSTGEILAIYGNVLEDTLHPGSAIKPILAAAVLTVNPELADYTYDCVPKNHEFATEQGTMTIQCADQSSHGTLSMADAMAVSCNGYFISLAEQADRERLLQELGSWGFDSCISYDQFLYWDHAFLKGSKKEEDFMLACIGQANAFITPAGMNFCTNALLNHGVLKEPVWILEKRSSQEDVWTILSNDRSYVKCSPQVADQVVEMMLGVTERGTGVSFSLPGFAAKTGTAQKADASGAITDRYTVWTTGGLTDPQTPYSVTVCLDDVEKETGSAQAGELAQRILLELTEGVEQG